ncbi:hypothetical protein DFH07DRAFT_975991 [Mycena maculata]|uniref:Uncharacterized protein n=1 Tax=Mycena maculata TaxID=230809 RepID=A0AAD7P2T3_9AGAR|nr:hypothetical protein DFH07DRAFT_975991 [Mycena maculata]
MNTRKINLTCKLQDDPNSIYTHSHHFTTPAPHLEYTSGVMMANHRLKAILPKPLKPGERAPPLKPVPGWTDGSQAWRTSTYSFAPPPKTRADVLNPNRTVYEGFIASPHRSTQSSVTASGERPSSTPASPMVLSTTLSSINSEMLSSFKDSFACRTASRISLFLPGTSPASSTGISPPQKQRPLAQAAAGGMLLVSNVMKHVAITGSTISLTAAEHRDSFTSASSGRDRHDSNLSSSSITSMLTRERTARRQPTPLLRTSGHRESSMDGHGDSDRAEHPDSARARQVANTAGAKSGTELLAFASPSAPTPDGSDISVA